jgi:predicted RNA-binding protein YlxR (DUF448 family)
LNAAAQTIETDGASGHVPERRCIVTGEVLPRGGMVRFVVRPPETGGKGELVPDLEGRLPGRGLWITARRDIVDRAVAKNSFARAAQAPVAVAADLSDRLESLLARRCIDHLGLARRAGQAVAGFEKVKAALGRGDVALLLQAADGSPEQRAKLRPRSGAIPVVALFSGAELAEIFGREVAVHAAILKGGIADRLTRDCARLAGFRETPN